MVVVMSVASGYLRFLRLRLCCCWREGEGEVMRGGERVGMILSLLRLKPSGSVLSSSSFLAGTAPGCRLWVAAGWARQGSRLCGCAFGCGP